jgi:hypothetical protein
MEFIRTSGEKCRVFEYNTTKPSKPLSAKYGDILVKKNGYRALETFICMKYGLVSCPNCKFGNGSGRITKTITRYIENPYTFYKGVITYGDIVEIAIDTEIHYNMLYELAGNRKINKKIIFEINMYGNVVFNSAKLWNGSFHEELVLNSKTNECYLQNKPFIKIDPISLKYIGNKSKKYKEIIKKISKGDNIICEHNINNMSSGSFAKILDIKYDSNNDIVEFHIENKDRHFETDKNILKFIPIYDNDNQIPETIRIPKWTCIDEEVKMDYFKYFFIPREMYFSTKYSFEINPLYIIFQDENCKKSINNYTSYNKYDDEENELNEVTNDVNSYFAKEGTDCEYNNNTETDCDTEEEG